MGYDTGIACPIHWCRLGSESGSESGSDSDLRESEIQEEWPPPQTSPSSMVQTSPSSMVQTSPSSMVTASMVQTSPSSVVTTTSPTFSSTPVSRLSDILPRYASPKSSPQSSRPCLGVGPHKAPQATWLAHTNNGGLEGDNNNGGGGWFSPVSQSQFPWPPPPPLSPPSLHAPTPELEREALHLSTQRSASAAAAPPSGKTAAAAAADTIYHGFIKTYTRRRGFGFIESPEAFWDFGSDVFIHQRQVAELHGQIRDVPHRLFSTFISFSVEVNDQGRPQARNIRRIDRF